MATLISKDTSGIYLPNDGEAEIPENRTRSFMTFKTVGENLYRVAGRIGPSFYREDPFDNDEQFKAIDLDIILTPAENWDAAVETNGYQIRLWQSREIAGKTVRYIAQFRRAGKWIAMAPLALVWENDAGERQLISKPIAGITPTVDNDDYHITWANCFGPGIHYRYNLRPDEFFKTVIIDNKSDLPTPTIGLAGLKLTVVLALSWHTLSQTANGFADSVIPNEIPNDIDDTVPDEELIQSDTFNFQDEFTRSTWWLQKPVAWDSAEEQHSIDLSWRLQRRNNRISATLSLPATALNNPNTVYPVYIDTDIAEEQVGAANDDAMRRYNTSVYLVNLNFIGSNGATQYQYCTGWVFRSIPIPQGATVTAADLTLTAQSADTGTEVKARIRGYDGDDYSDTLSIVSKWAAIFPGSLTTAQVDWDDYPSWVIDTEYTSPDIATVLHEIVNRGGWVTGNDIVLFWDDYDDRTAHTSGKIRRSYDYSQSAAKSTKLNATYSDATAHVGTPSDTISLADTLVVGAVKPISDSLSLADALVSKASEAPSDSLSLVDALVSGAESTLADSLSVNDALVSALVTVINLADSVSLSDALTLAAAEVLADNISIVDALVSGGSGSVGIADTLFLTDALVQQAGLTPSDAVSLVDFLSQVKDSIQTSTDMMTITDNLTGVLTSGITLPGTGDVTSGDTISGGRVRQPGTWRKSMSSNPSPLTLYSRSSANTTFTVFGVTDASAWDLTQVKQGDILITEDGYKARVRSTGANQIIITDWVKGGQSRKGMAVDIPTDGQQVSLHKPIRAKKVLIRAHPGNTNTVYVGFDENLHPDDGHPIAPTIGQANDSVVIEAPRDRWLNLSRIWVVAGTLQTVIVTPEAEEIPVGTSDIVRATDILTLTGGDSLTLAAHSKIEDAITVTDELTSSFVPNLIEDTITLSDNLSAVFTPVGGVVDGLYMYNAQYYANHVVGMGLYKIGGVSQGTGLISIDVSTPGSPTVANFLPVDGATYGKNDYQSVLRGDYLYCAVNNLGLGDPAIKGGFTIWDVSNPAAPTFVSRMEIDFPGGSHSNVFRLDVNAAGTIVACACPDSTVQLVMCNVNVKATPLELRRGRAGYYDNVETPPASGTFISEWRDDGLTTPKNYVFGAGYDAVFGEAGVTGPGVAVVDGDHIWHLNISNLEADPSITLGHWIGETTHDAATLATEHTGSSNYYTVGDGDYPNNFQINIGPNWQGECYVSMSGTWQMNAITYNNLYCYVSRSSELSVIDVSDKTNPSVVETTGHYARQNVTFNGNYMYVAAGSQGFRIYDNTDPTNLISIAQLLPY